MKAVKILKPHRVSLCEIPQPVLNDEDILIKVKALGLCGSDLKTYRGLNPLVDYPRIPGHEVAGEIVETGPQVPPSFTAGLSVTVSPYTSCGSCSACRTGRVNCCKDNQTLGVQRDGAAVEYISVPYSKVFIAEGLTDHQIACVEPLSIGWHASNRAEISQGDIVLVFGCGVVGLGAILASSYKRARVIAVDIDSAKLQKAKTLGAKYLINSNEQDLHTTVDRITSGDGPHVVIEAVGLPETFLAAVTLVSFAGCVVYIGYAKEAVEYQTSLFVKKELDIRGSRNAHDTEIRAVIDTLRSGEIDVSPLVTQQYELEQTAKALSFWDRYPAEVTKVLIYV